MLKCVTCNLQKEVSEFYISQQNFRSPRCKPCMRISIKRYYHANKDKYLKINREYNDKFRDQVRMRNHKSKLKIKYNMTVDQYNELLSLQKHACAICKKPERLKDKRFDYPKALCVDHCHKTNKIRGLLCDACNRALGMFFESIENLESAIEYIKKHS